MTTPPPEATPSVVAPTASETRALQNAAADEEVRALAQQLQKSTELGFDPTSISKGIITAVKSNASPPTVSILISGDTTTTISDVRLLNNYSPVVGQTVLIGKQGANIFVLGHTADVNATSVGPEGSGWIRATLSSGSHGGNLNGDVYYRRILDHGSWKMQWRGGWALDEGASAMIDTGQALPTEYRPTSLRSVVAARQLSTGAVSVQFDFHSDGRVILTGGTQSANSAVASGDVGFISMSTGSSFAGSTVSHNHGGAVASASITHGSNHTHGASHDHSFSGGSHTHGVSMPTWASLNGVEYFL